VAASPSATESDPEQLLMKADSVLLHREKEKPRAFRGEWGTLILTSRRLIFVPGAGLLSIRVYPKCDTLESIELALGKKGSLQIPINTMVDLRKDSIWVSEYLKVRSQDRTGQKLNLFLESRGEGDHTVEYYWQTSPSGKAEWLKTAILTSRPHWDVWIEKLNTIRAGNARV
jgi:hypothetical protein